jgi:hypothetical protein
MDLEYFTMVHLAYQIRFRYNNQIFVNFHLYDAVDSLDGRFFGEVIGRGSGYFATVLIGKWAMLLASFTSKRHNHTSDCPAECG